jgi:hypothetical protein
MLYTAFNIRGRFAKAGFDHHQINEDPEKKILVIGWILYPEAAVYFIERSKGSHVGKQGDQFPVPRRCGKKRYASGKSSDAKLSS